MRTYGQDRPVAPGGARAFSGLQILERGEEREALTAEARLTGRARTISTEGIVQKSSAAAIGADALDRLAQAQSWREPDRSRCEERSTIRAGLRADVASRAAFVAQQPPLGAAGVSGEPAGVVLTLQQSTRLRHSSSPTLQRVVRATRIQVVRTRARSFISLPELNISSDGSPRSEDVPPGNRNPFPNPVPERLSGTQISLPGALPMD